MRRMQAWSDSMRAGWQGALLAACSLAAVVMLASCAPSAEQGTGVDAANPADATQRPNDGGGGGAVPADTAGTPGDAVLGDAGSSDVAAPGDGQGAPGDVAASCPAGATYCPPPGYAILTMWVDDSANQTFSDGQIRWTGSFSWDDATNTVTYATAWEPTDGPFPPLWDDGPISQGGHEMEGATAGDHVFSTEVYFLAEEDTTIEYGLLNEFDNWMWVGPNGVVDIPAGTTGRIDFPGMVIEPFGDIDLKLTLDTNALHEQFAGSAPAKVFVKGTMNMWAPVQILDNGEDGDDTAGDGIYTYVHSLHLGPHDGLLNPGQEVQFVFVFAYSEDATADEGVEYKVDGDAVPDGVRAYTDSGGGWQEQEVVLRPDSKGKTMNTAIVVPGEAPGGCKTDADCAPGETCQDGACEPAQPTGCATDADCAPGETCQDGACEPAQPTGCATDADCASGETCQDGQCEAPAGPAPSILAVDPASGPTTGGTAVTIYGDGFAPGATVSFGGVDATDVLVADAATLTCVTPPHDAGTVDVRVVNPDGQDAIFAGGFTYVAPGEALTISAVEPAQGSVEGGTEVHIYGTGFASGAVAAFGATSAETTWVSATELVATTPPAAQPGAVDVSVVNPDGTKATLPAAFEYVPELPDWAGLVDASAQSVPAGVHTGVLRASVFEPGQTPPRGPSPGLVAQVGFGPDGSDPSDASAGWTWQDAHWWGQDGPNDVYWGVLSTETPGHYDYAFRFSVDGGATWLYADATGSDDGYAPADAGAFDVTALGDQPVVYELWPRAVGPKGGASVAVHGAGLATASTLRVDGAEVQFSTTPTGLSFVAPAHALGTASVEVELADGTLVASPTPLAYAPVGTPQVDGVRDADEWPDDAAVATTDLPPDWGAGLNELHRVWLAYDADMLYVAIEGRVEGPPVDNALVAYLDLDMGNATGVADTTELTDNAGNGDLDDALSGLAATTAAGFGADVAAGTVGGASFEAGPDLSGAAKAGWRGLASPNDLAWLAGSVVTGEGFVEMAIPWGELLGSALDAPRTLAGFVRLTNHYGNAYAVQALPQDVSGDANEVEASVFTVDVAPLLP